MSANHRLSAHQAPSNDRWSEYEIRKAALKRKNLSSRAYELEIQRIARELGV
jgi:hypothetical protein